MVLVWVNVLPASKGVELQPLPPRRLSPALPPADCMSASPSPQGASRAASPVPASQLEADAGAASAAAQSQEDAQLRAVLTSGEQPQAPLDVKALIATPDKLKKACRLGVPWGQRKEVWYELVKLHTDPVSTDYLSTKLEVFNGVAHPVHFPHIPDFGSTMTWNEAYIHLTHKRINDAKTLLCVLACSHAALTHCPLLPDLTCVLLIYFDEARVYELLERMLNRSKRDEYYFTTNGTAFLRWMQTFNILLQQKNEPLHRHMHSTLRIDPAKLFQAWLCRAFLQYLPMRTVFRVLDAFLMEGNKILFRVGLAILKLHTKALLECRTQTEFLKRLHGLMTTQLPGTLLATGFDIYLSRTGHLSKIADHVDEQKRELLANPPNSRHAAHFHLPRFNQQLEHVSELVDIEHLYSLWSWLPPVWMICDPVLLYSSSIHGYSYAALWRSACESVLGSNTAVFLLLKDADTGQVLGLYLNKPLPDPTDVLRAKGVSASVSLYTGNTDGSSARTNSEALDPHAFLFTLRPRAEVFKHFVMEKESRANARYFKKKQQRIVTEGSTNSDNKSAAAVASTATGATVAASASAAAAAAAAADSSTPPGAEVSTGRGEDSQGFKPYGLSDQEHNIAPLDVRSSSPPTLAISIEGPGGAISAAGTHHGVRMEPHSAIDNAAMLEKMYSNTLGAPGAGAAAAAALSHFQATHPHLHHLSALDVAQSSHSMITMPSEGIQHSQPLDELFSGLAVSRDPTQTPIPSPHASEHAAKLAASPAQSPLMHMVGSPNSLGLPEAGSGAQFSLPSPAVKDAAGGSRSLHLASPISGNATTSSSSSTIALSSAAPASVASAVPASPSPSPSAAAPMSLSDAAALAAAADAALDAELAAGPGEAMLLMTDNGFGIVETGGTVLFVASDLKTCVSRPSKVFGSPSFAVWHDAADSASSASSASPGSRSPSPSRSPHLSAQRQALGKFNVSTIEMWSFATPGSDLIEALSPRMQRQQSGGANNKS